MPEQIERVVPPTEVDSASEAEFRQAVDEACARRPSRVVVDFRDVTFCDSTALRVLERVPAQQIDLTVQNPSRMLRRIIDVTGAHHLLGG